LSARGGAVLRIKRTTTTSNDTITATASPLPVALSSSITKDKFQRRSALTPLGMRRAIRQRVNGIMSDGRA
jgi:hypothetical protein